MKRIFYSRYCYFDWFVNLVRSASSKPRWTELIFPRFFFLARFVCCRRLERGYTYFPSIGAMSRLRWILNLSSCHDAFLCRPEMPAVFLDEFYLIRPSKNRVFQDSNLARFSWKIFCAVFPSLVVQTSKEYRKGKSYVRFNINHSFLAI